MKPRLLKTVLALCLLSNLNPHLSTGFAQSTAFTYQGRLNDDGAPANGIYDLRFVLWDALTGGMQYGTFPVTGVAVTNGLFVVALDFGAAPFNGNARWLDIDVRTNGGGNFSSLSPRQPVTPTPYALQAAKAAAVSDASVGTTSLQDGSVTRAKIAPDQVVTSINGIHDGVSIYSGGGISVDTDVQTHQIRLSAPSMLDYWRIGGNDVYREPVLGPTNSDSLDFRLFGSRVWRFEEGFRGNSPAPNIIGGSSNNWVSQGSWGAFIGGGGSSNRANQVMGSYGVVVGGASNTAGYYSFVGGGENNIANSHSFVGSGAGNEIQGWNSAIAGGDNNRVAAGGWNFIGAGYSNQVSGTFAAAVAGQENQVGGEGAFVGGGNLNTNNGQYASIAGGRKNFATGRSSFISGGEGNRADGFDASVLGGLGNQASGGSSTAVGGVGNIASGFAAFVAGGSFNQASGNAAIAMGGGVAGSDGSLAVGSGANATHPRAFVLNALNYAVTSSVPNEILLGGQQFTFTPNPDIPFDAGFPFRVGGNAQFSGMVKANQFIGDGSALTNIAASQLTGTVPLERLSGITASQLDAATWLLATNNAGNGWMNTNNGQYAFIAGGENNLTTGRDSFISGGYGNRTHGSYASVLAGAGNTASGGASAVAGGWGNIASGDASFIAGGSYNRALGNASVVLGGSCEAGGEGSLAAGTQAHADHMRSFVWNALNVPMTSSVPQEIIFGGSQFTFAPGTNLPFEPYYMFRVGSDAHVLGQVKANRFIGDGSLLTGVVASNATTAENFTGSLLGEVAGTQRATVVMAVGGVGASSVASGASAANAASSASIPSAIVKRDAGGNFTAGTITAKLAGNATTASLASNVVSGVAITNAFITNSVFAGNGAALTGVNAATVGGLAAASFWKIGGNSGIPEGQSILGNLDNRPLEIQVASSRVARYEFNVNSPNIINGNPNNAVAGGAHGVSIGGGGSGLAGGSNSVSANYGAIAGGAGHTVGDTFSFVGGGYGNKVLPGSGYSTIGGGWDNVIQSNCVSSVIAGGSGNRVDTNSTSVTISGGSQNKAGPNANRVVIAGGEANVISNAAYASVGGGDANQIHAGASYSTIAGGGANVVGASALYATIPGGNDNVAAGNFSFAAGQRAKANHQGSFVWADSQFSDFGSTARDQFLIRAQGGVGINKSNPATALDVEGTVRAIAFSGNGIGVTNLSASQLASGTLHSDRLSGTYFNALIFNNSANSFTGGGAGLTSVNAELLDGQHGSYYLNAGNLTGILPDARLSGNVALLNSAQAFSGAKTFSDNVRVSDKQIYLRGGSDTLHGLGWFVSGTFAGSNPDGPVLYGCGGGALGATCSGQVIALAWNNVGRVGIGRSSAANRLEVEGEASKTTAGSWAANSDARIKTDIATVTNALETLARVRPVSFRYAEEYRAAHPSIEDRAYVNVVAQEFREVFPDSVKSSGETLPDGSEILQVDTYPLTLYSAAAIQELNQKLEDGKQKAEHRIERLEQTLQQKQTEITELRQRLEKLEQLLNQNRNEGGL